MVSDCLRTKTENLTTINDEVAFYKAAADKHLESFTFPKGGSTLIEKICLIFKNESAKKDKQLTEKGLEDIKKVVEYYVDRNLPVLIRVAYLTDRFNNSMKFLDRTPLPHIGYIDIAHFAYILNEKLKMVYEPGCQIYIEGESFLYQDILGLSNDSIHENTNIFLRIANKFQAPIDIIHINPDCFDDEKVNQFSVGPLADEQIYAFMCMFPEADSRVLKDLYVNKEKNYQKIFSENRELYNKAVEHVNIIFKKMEYRKTDEFKDGDTLYQRLLTRPYIRGCFLRKDDAWTPKRLLNPGYCHGMVLFLSRKKMKRIIMPESRILTNYPDAERVMIKAYDIGQIVYNTDEMYTFYYKMPE